MKALQWNGKHLVFGETDAAAIAPGQCRVRIDLAGVCATDLEITKGYSDYRGILGHEFVGTVCEGPSEWLGCRVVADINCPCGTCVICERGRGHHCPHRTVVGIVNRPGAFAENVVLPTSNLVVVPHRLSNESAVFAEPLAAALHIQTQVELSVHEPILVVGDGRLGLLIAGSLAHAGYAVEVLGRHPERVELYDRYGLGFSVRPPKKRRTVVIEATGRPEGFALALESTAPCGTLVMKSTYAAPLTFDATALVVDEITIVGSRCGTMAQAIEFMDLHGFDPTPLIDGQFELSQGENAFTHAATSGVLKVLLKP